MYLTCDSCHQPIPNGLAVIRSIDFERVAWHRDCYGSPIPAQRTGLEQVPTVVGGAA